MEKIIEEVTLMKYEKLQEIKVTFDQTIKKLEMTKRSIAAENKKKEREQAVQKVQEDIEKIKKTKIDTVNKEYEKKKREIMEK